VIDIVLIPVVRPPLNFVKGRTEVAKHLDTRIAWDAANLRVTNNPLGEALIRRPYRAGWGL
jgi:hypothetical protein